MENSKCVGLLFWLETDLTYVPHMNIYIMCITITENEIGFLSFLTGFDSLNFARPQPSSPFMHRKQEQRNKQETSTQILTWKPKCGKNHGSPQTAEYTMERNTTRRIHIGNDLLSSSSPHATVVVEAMTSHTLTLTLSL